MLEKIAKLKNNNLEYVPVRIDTPVLFMYRLRWRITWVGSSVGRLDFTMAVKARKSIRSLVLQVEQVGLLRTSIYS
jgi:hypothetical protein